MTSAPRGDRRTVEPTFEAPHVRSARGPRLREKAVLHAYRSASWVLARIPPRISITVGGWLALGVYAAWPEKRHYVRANMARVLGLAPGDPSVGRLARQTYRTYARYVVELMRLPWMGPGEAAALVDIEGAETVERQLAASREIIMVAAHLGNNEMAAAGIASRGWPTSAVADNSAYQELFELLARQRASWGVRLVRWTNLREVFRILHRREILGLLVDWGYRPDGIPVEFFGAWTRLPAGPAVLAAKSGATILPVAVQRKPNGRFRVFHGEPIEVPSTDPVEIRRATQRLAASLEEAIRGAPDQWHTFKPIWPATEAEQERVAAEAQTSSGSA